MHDNFKVANYSKAVLSPELYARHLSRLLTGDVIDGLTVAPGTGLQVVLAPGNALLRYGAAAVASARLMSLVANFNLAIGTADASNPRIDLVVVYIDNAVNLPSGTPSAANLDGKGVAKAKIVAGTPASSPSAPNATAIQSSVGAGNPYTVVAQVRINAGVSVISAGQITDVRSRTRPIDDSVTADSLLAVGSSTTDANGWSVRDYGLFKLAEKVVNSSATKVRFETVTSTSVNLPVGVATVAALLSQSFGIEGGSFSDLMTITRNNSPSNGTAIELILMCLGPTSATTYSYPVRYSVIF